MNPEPSAPVALNCYVRVTDTREDGFVEFEFAIGDPELAVELVMPEPAFQEFCARYRAVHLDGAVAERLDHERLKWRFGAPGITH